MIHIVRLIDGRQATYEVVGSGETAMWLQGGPTPADAATGACHLVAKLFRSYLVDAPGSGGSSPLPQGQDDDLESVARFYDAVRRTLGLGEVTVLGSGAGARQALAYAALYPAATRRCVALDPTHDDALCGLLPHVAAPTLVLATGQDGAHGVAEQIRSCQFRSAGEPSRLADVVAEWLAGGRQEASTAS